jgi:hypothetical protein
MRNHPPKFFLKFWEGILINDIFKQLHLLYTKNLAMLVFVGINKKELNWIIA